MKKVSIYKETVAKACWLTITIFMAILLVFRVSRAIAYNQNVNVHVQNAGKASTTAIAIEELETALDNADKYGCRHGKASALDEENAVDLYYSNLEGFLSELKSFDENTNREVYQVELNALQERLNEVEGTHPYGISMGGQVVFNLYGIFWILEIITALVFYKEYDDPYHETIEITVPSFKKKDQVASEKS